MPLVQLIANCAYSASHEVRQRDQPRRRTVNVCNQLHGALTASGGVERCRSWFDNT